MSYTSDAVQMVSALCPASQKDSCLCWINACMTPQESALS
uniref:Uncharacterized protein n=1 Tax=Faecalibaculum rodentium TaxID=1702221 RepID=A0A140DU59_9FIRM|nr:hypothetical protein AALO17_10520 [Faecalibaculum rodentium]